MKIEDCFNIIGGNSGLTEEVIYNFKPTSLQNTVQIFSSALSDKTAMGHIDKHAYIGGKKIKTFNEPCIIISRNGNAGLTSYTEKLIATTDHAYIITAKEKYKNQIDLKWFSIFSAAIIADCISNNGSNATFSKDLFLKQEISYPFPDISEQKKIVAEYEKIENIKKKVAEYSDKINALLFLSIEYSSHETKKIGDLFIVKTGRRITEEDVYNHIGSFPCITSQTSNNGITWLADYSWLNDNYNKYIVTADECLTWTKDGAKCGTFFYRDFSFYPNDHCGVLIPKKEYKDEINLKWFMYTHRAYINSFVTQNNSQAMLYNGTMENIEIPYPFPKRDEQDAIVEQYERLETLINKLNRLSKINGFCTQIVPITI